MAALQLALLSWYRPRSRPIRIRRATDAWAILVAEVMAQQTQIERVDAAWVEFMARFPTVQAVAAATTADILRAWAGLGYNRRALNLQAAARDVVERHDGVVPRDVDALMALPGIGPYTARAVAAAAYGVRVAAVDTNVRRVVTRLGRREMTDPEVQARADQLLDRTDPAAWTNAMMDLGATVCRARVAACEACPIATWCASAGMPVIAGKPVRSAAPMAFERTTRWLRGRIVSELRDAAGAEWSVLPSRLGSHDRTAIALAVDALADEGLIEKGPDESLRLPS